MTTSPPGTPGGLPAAAAPHPRPWVGIGLLLGGFVVVGLGFYGSVLAALNQGDDRSTATPTVVFVVGSVIGAAMVLAGIALMVVTRRRPV